MKLSLATELLLKPGLYHYASYLSQDINDSNLQNTLELFAYGDFKHYIMYREQYIQLDESCIEKLSHLSLFTYLGKNVGNTVSLSDILYDVAFTDSFQVLEDTLMLLVDQECINVKINQNNNTLLVQEVFVLRDAYSGKIPLRVLSKEDIRFKSVDWARKVLRAWLDDKIKPTRELLLQKPHEMVEK